MSEPERIFVTIAMDFSQDILAELREISPRLHIERHFPDVPLEAIARTEVLYTAGYFPQPEQAPKLRWIQMNTAGMNHALEHDIVQAEDIVVTSTSGIHATNMAHYSLMMMLMFNYQMRRAFELQNKAEWPEHPHQQFLPVDMDRQTVGIVGYGSIGRELARLCAGMDMTVLASKRDLSNTAEVNAFVMPNTGDPTGDIPDRIYPADTVASMAKDCDYLVVTTPQTATTERLIGEEVFEAMKDSAVLVSVSRGAIVDEKALITALSSGQIGGAALDVFEEEPLPNTSPLWNLENVVITPHLSGFTRDYHDKAALVFKENLRRYLENRPLLNQLDRAKGY
ncbi:MAG: D-2-hydroxyacid dehydrogenase [Chloroflexota bacterium]|nr:D-2-hydroxyacid dehydrogenase [Chloroflexota bacterium]